MKLFAYLTFNGNCRQAMKFYQQCFGGKLTFHSVRHTPEAQVLPVQVRRLIVQATLRKEDWVLLGTDMVGDEGLLKGNAVSMQLNCKTKHHAQKIYDKLSKGAHCIQPLTVNYYGLVMGGVTDRYGHRWLVTA